MVTMLGLLLASTLALPFAEAKVRIPMGGTLAFPVSYDLLTLNPFVGTTAVEYYVYELIYEPLLVVSAEWTTEPRIAYAVDVSEDGLTWTLHLLNNVTWSDGVPFTAQDVKFNFDYRVQKQIPGYETYLIIESITTPDDYTVIFHFNETSATFYADLARTFIVPKHIWENVDDPVNYENANPIGNGPFMLAEWNRGQYIILGRNPNYWAAPQPYVDRIIFRIIGTYDAQKFAFDAEELDALPIQALDAPGYEGLEDVELYPYLIANTIYMSFNMRMAPMNDKQFRYAVAYAIDHEEINELSNAGYGIVWQHFWCAPFEDGGWINPDIKTYDYNVDLAKSTLDNAGYIDVNDDGYREFPNGTKLSLSVLVGSGMLAYYRPAQVIVENLQAVGLDVTLEALEVGTWVTRMMTRDFELGMFGQGVVNNDPDIFVYQRYHSSQTEYPLGNYEGFVNATYDELAELQRTAVDVAERQQIIQQAEAILAEELPTICLPNQIRIQAVYKNKYEGWVNMPGQGPVTYMNRWTFIGLHYLTLEGDVDGNGSVNIVDLAKIATAWGAKTGEPKYNPYSDINDDGIINILDIATAAKNFGKSVYRP